MHMQGLHYRMERHKAAAVMDRKSFLLEAGWGAVAEEIKLACRNDHQGRQRAKEQEQEEIVLVFRRRQDF